MRALAFGIRVLLVLCGLAAGLALHAQTTAALLEQLKAPDAATRVTAIQQLGRQRAREAVPALIAITRENSPTLRAQAAAALGQIGDPQAGPALIALLADPFALTRAAAATALGLLKERAAVPALAKAARDPESGIQVTAIEALGRIGDGAAVPDLLALLEDPEAEVRRAAGAALGAMHDPHAALAFLPALHDPDAAIRLAAVQALAPFREPQARPTFIALLQDESAEVRAAAADALGRYTDANTREVLLRTLATSEDDAIRASCLSALAPTRDPRLLEPVLKILDEKSGNPGDGRLLAAAVEVAGQLRDARAVPALMSLLGRDIDIGDSQDIRDPLDRAFRRIGTPVLVALLSQLPPDVSQPERQAAISALGRWQHPRAMEPLLALMYDGDVGYDAAVALCARHAADTFYLKLEAGMHEPIAFNSPWPEPGVWCHDLRLEDYLLAHASTNRMDMYEHLGDIGSSRAVDSILAELKTADANRKRHLIQAAGFFSDPRLADVMLALYTRGSSTLDTLMRIPNPPALEPYFTALQHKDTEVRKRVAAMLGAQKDARALPPLLNRIQNDPDAGVREYCALALGMIGDGRAVPVLIQRLNDPTEWARSAAAWALGQIGDPRAITPLKAKLNVGDPRFAVRVARSLAQLGDAAGSETMLTLLKSTDQSVRGIAAQTVHSLPGEWAVIAALAIPPAPDEDPGIRTANVLREIRDPAAAGRLLPLLQHEDMDIRAAAAHALGYAGAATARDPLAACLDAGDATLASEAAVALTRLGDPRGLPLVLEAIADPVSPLRGAALDALGKGKLPGVETAPLCETLAAVLADPDPFAAILAARALARYDDGRGAEHLLGLLAKHEDPAVYLIAVPVLAELRDRRATAPLQALLPKTTFPVRLRIIEALGAIGDPAALPLLTNLTRHPDPRVREALARGLWGQGVAAMPLLQPLRNDDATRTRAAADASAKRIMGVVGTIIEPGK